MEMPSFYRTWTCFVHIFFLFSALSFAEVVETHTISSLPTTLSGTATFSFTEVDPFDNSTGTGTLTLTGGDQGAVTMTHENDSYEGLIVGLTVFIKGDNDESQDTLVFTFTDTSFTSAVGLSGYKTTGGTDQALEIFKLELSSGSLSVENLGSTAVSGSGTVTDQFYSILNTDGLESETFDIVANGSSLITVDGDQGHIYGRFIAFANIESDSEYSYTLALFDDETLTTYTGMNAGQDAAGPWLEVSHGSVEGLSMNHTPMFEYEGSSLTYVYGYSEFGSGGETKLIDTTDTYTDRSGETIAGTDTDNNTFQGFLIGPILFFGSSEGDQWIFSFQNFLGSAYTSSLGLSFAQDNNGSFRYSEIAHGSSGSSDLSYQAKTQDDSGSSEVTISGTPTTTIEAGQLYIFTPSASDSSNRTLTFSISNLPTWASFDSSTGTLSGTPTQGTYSNISISASNGETSASLNTFTITVTASTSTVSISGTPNAYGIIGEVYSFTPSAEDTQGNTLTFSIDSSSLPSWAEFNSSTGQISGTPTATGTHTIPLTASNDNGSASLNVEFQVVQVLGTPSQFSLSSGGLGQPAVYGGAPPYTLSLSESSSSLSLQSQASGTFQQYLLGAATGTSTITITDDSGQSVSTSATVVSNTQADIPYESSALTSVNDYSMVTFPFLSSDLSGSDLFSKLETSLGTYGEDYILYQYSPNSGSYSQLNASSTPVGAGYGYWLGTLTSGNYQVLENAPSTESNVNIYLYEGWNLIGNPYAISLSSSDITYFKDGSQIQITSSEQSDLGHHFWWANSNGDYFSLSSLAVGQAAWIYSHIDTSLTFSYSSSSTKARHSTSSATPISEVDMTGEPIPPTQLKASSTLQTSSSSSSSGGGGGGGCLLKSWGGSK